MNLLLEIGAEEIPDWMLAGALEYLGTSINALLKDNQLGGTALRTDATPRRLVVRAEGIAPQQPNSEERVWGPAKTAPHAAVAGFAKKQGIDPDQLEILSDGKAEKYSYVRKIAGRPATTILAEALPALVLKTPFPKSMYWTGKGGVRFIRPIRWIVALLDNEIIPFEIAGIPAGNESSGHRKLGATRFPVTFETYEQKLRDNYVILSANERRERIQAVATKYKCDNDLLNTLVNLTEWPTPITGSFDPEYLDLPKEVLMMVMRHHQKYFAVETPDGNLAPQFVAVTNTDGDPDGLIRHGNERVLRARFNDARFFWNADQKRVLNDRVLDLANVTFQAKLGTYLEKTERIEELALTLSQFVIALQNGTRVTRDTIRDAKVRFTFNPDSPEFHIVRAARLCKADLTTELVKEFTELQGIVGGLYALAQGEPEPVAIAIYDHYKPESMDAAIPGSLNGQLLSIADKLDTLRGCFKVGLIPSGSKDPFALRRTAQGIVKILVEGKLRLPIQSLCEGSTLLEEFFAERIRYYFREIRGFKYDEINAVLVSGWDDLLDVEERLAAVRDVRPTEDFEPLAASFKRIRNILKQANFEGLGDALNPALLEDGPERELYEKFMATRAACQILSDYRGKLEQIASLRTHVDKFFDKTLVNAPDPAVRQNRLTLLHTMLAETSTIADFSEIVTDSTASSGRDNQSGPRSTAGPTNSPDPDNQASRRSTAGPGDSPDPDNQAGPRSTAGPGDSPDPDNQSSRRSTAGPSDSPGPDNQSSRRSTAGPSDSPGPDNQSGPRPTAGPSDSPDPDNQASPRSTAGPGDSPGSPDRDNPASPRQTAGPGDSPGSPDRDNPASPRQTAGPGDSPGSPDRNNQASPRQTAGPSDSPGSPDPDNQASPRQTAGPSDSPGSPDPDNQASPRSTAGPGDSLGSPDPDNQARPRSTAGPSDSPGSPDPDNQASPRSTAGPSDSPITPSVSAGKSSSTKLTKETT